MGSSPSSTLRAYAQLCRPFNALMAAIGTLIGYLLVQPTFSFSPEIISLNLLLVLLSVAFIISGGQAVNDFFDRDIDATQKKTRPIPSGKIPAKNACLFSAALFLVGIALAWSANSPTQLTFPIAFFFSVLLIAYSAFMQRLKFAGNVVVALGTGFTYIFGASISRITPLILVIALAAFLANWAREIIKDVEDREMDKGNKLTLPLITKSGNVHVIVAIILLAAVMAGYFPAIFFRASAWYVALVTLANVIFIFAFKKLIERNPAKAAALMKKGMLMALLAQLSLLFF